MKNRIYNCFIIGYLILRLFVEHFDLKLSVQWNVYIGVVKYFEREIY